MSYETHAEAATHVVASCAVVTLSDTRTPDSDKSGQLIGRLLTEAGHVVGRYDVIKDDPGALTALLARHLEDLAVDVILTTGGTGVSRRDQTIQVIDRAIDLPLPGFGELFRMLSWEQVGSGAMLSRATAGVARGKPIFAMPGSTRAVELAMTKLILPELGHLLVELRK
jgi:molybdenum cofactor biosynthesis protein B